MYVYMMYVCERGENDQNVEEAGENDGAEAAKKRISYEGPEKRQQRGRSVPYIDVSRRSRRGLSERPTQIAYQI